MPIPLGGVARFGGMAAVACRHVWRCFTIPGRGRKPRQSVPGGEPEPSADLPRESFLLAIERQAGRAAREFGGVAFVPADITIASVNLS